MKFLKVIKKRPSLIVYAGIFILAKYRDSPLVPNATIMAIGITQASV